MDRVSLFNPFSSSHARVGAEWLLKLINKCNVFDEYKPNLGN